MKKIKRIKFDVYLRISLFLRVFESECLPTFVKNREIGVSHHDKIPSFLLFTYMEIIAELYSVYGDSAPSFTTIKISYEWAYNILHTELGVRKLCARWVSRLLTVDQN